VTGYPIPMIAGDELSPPLMDSLVVLKRNYRFSVDSGIGSAAKAVRGGDGPAALAVFTGEAHPEMVWRGVPAASAMKGELTGAVIGGYDSVLKSASPGEALAAFESFRILCALRRGPYGVAAINELVEDILAGKGLIDPSTPWYHGRPVMVTANDYNQGLFNGDVGIAFADPPGKVRLFFPATGGGLRSFSPLRLPEHETAYAMTVHKSQGSEFERALLLLPPADSEVLTRELLYTAITRARSGVEIWGDEKVFATAVERRTLRKSGIRDALWPRD
jgi:exodeoxyribonuclease V alpha subunit